MDFLVTAGSGVGTCDELPEPPQALKTNAEKRVYAPIEVRVLIDMICTETEITKNDIRQRVVHADRSRQCLSIGIEIVELCMELFGDRHLLKRLFRFIL